MSSSINLNLTGVGDEIAAAAVDAIRKQQATSESSVLIGKEIAKQIGKEVSARARCCCSQNCFSRLAKACSRLARTDSWYVLRVFRSAR
jgi:hypothetical protein